jgi:uncharacterized cupredoxin-like copper-binding protein
MRIHRRGAFALAALILLSAACSTATGESGKGDVSVTLRDFEISLPGTTVPTGNVTFDVVNQGPSTHELEVFFVPAGVDPNTIQVSAGVADTSALTAVDEVEDVAPSTTAKLSVALNPGTYLLICNLPGHFEQGMHVAVTAG